MPLIFDNLTLVLFIFTSGYDYCEITNTSVTALFGDDAEIAAEVEFVPTSNEGNITSKEGGLEEESTLYRINILLNLAANSRLDFALGIRSFE